MKLSERPIQEIDGKSEESAALALSGHLGIFCRCSSIFLTTLSKFGQCTVTFSNYHVSMSSSHPIFSSFHSLLICQSGSLSICQLANLLASQLVSLSAFQLAHLGACELVYGHSVGEGLSIIILLYNI